nr:uncharacterized protein LOC109150426 [Ipomoea batatas]
MGASPKEVSPKEVKRKSVHERLGPVAIIKKYTKSPLSIEPSKEIKSAVPSRMRREADVNVLCGEVLKARPKIIVHTFVQEENEESMKSSYATYQDVQDVEAPKNWRRERSKANCRFPPATVVSRFETRSQRNGLKDMPETAAKKGKANDFISKLRIKRQPPEIKCDPHMGFRRNASVQPLFWLHHCIAIVIMSSGVQQKSQIPIQRLVRWSRQSVFNRLGASTKEVKKKSVHERLGPVPTIKKHTKSTLGAEPSKEVKSAVPSRMRRKADVNVLCGEVLKIRPKIIVHTSMQEENEETMESSYATYENGKDVEAPKNWRVIAWP